VLAADCSVRSVEGERLLVVDRYDRVPKQGGGVQRLHQEDICQAVAANPQFKYEAAGGPSLQQVAKLLDQHSFRPGIDRAELFRLATVNALLGNCDARAKNLSLLHTSDGVTLAPAYDVVSTAVYARHAEALGMRVGAVRRLSEVNYEALLAVAAEMGISDRLARAELGELRLGLSDALDVASARAHDEGWYCALLERLDEETRARAERMLR